MIIIQALYKIFMCKQSNIFNVDFLLYSQLAYWTFCNVLEEQYWKVGFLAEEASDDQHEGEHRTLKIHCGARKLVEDPGKGRYTMKIFSIHGYKNCLVQAVSSFYNLQSCKFYSSSFIFFSFFNGLSNFKQCGFRNHNVKVDKYV